MALSANRSTKEMYFGASLRHEITGADSTQFYKGGIVGILPATGKLKKAAAADGVTLVVVGRCEDNVLTGSSNTVRIKCKSGIFNYVSGADADAIDIDDVGKLCYVIDDLTVGLTASTRPVAGIIYDVDANGVWVAMLYPLRPGLTGATGPTGETGPTA